MFDNVFQRKNLSEMKGEISLADLWAVIDRIIEEFKDVFEAENKNYGKDEIIARKDAKRLLRIKTDLTIINYEKKGLIKPIKIGGRVWYRKSDIMSVIEGKNTRSISK